MNVLRITSLAVAIVAMPTIVQAQRAAEAVAGDGRVIGTVVDANTWLPVAGAVIRLRDVDRPALVTDSAGHFTIGELPAAVLFLDIRHADYGHGGYLVNVPEGETVTLRALLAASPLVPDSLVITAIVRVTQLGPVGFLEREKRGRGHFFREEDVAAGRIVHSIRRVPYIEIVGRRVSINNGGRKCDPPIYVDGLQTAANGDIEALARRLEIIALEVYRGTDTPQDFRLRYGRTCGAIIIWSRG